MKVFKPIQEHEARSEILIKLSLKNYNSSELSTILKKNQSGIHRHLLYLKKEKYLNNIKKNQEISPINYNKLSEEYIKFLDDDLKKIDLNKTKIIQERFLNKLIKNFLIFYNEKKENTTLKKIFYEIKRTSILWFYLNNAILNNFAEEENKKFEQKYPETYKLCSGLYINSREEMHKKYFIDKIIHDE